MNSSFKFEFGIREGEGKDAKDIDGWEGRRSRAHTRCGVARKVISSTRKSDVDVMWGDIGACVLECGNIRRGVECRMGEAVGEREAKNLRRGRIGSLNKYIENHCM